MLDICVIIMWLFSRFQNDVFGLSMFVVHGHSQQGGDSSTSFHLAAESPRQTQFKTVKNFRPNENAVGLSVVDLDPDPVDL
jgi:hypothetical protein